MSDDIEWVPEKMYGYLSYRQAHALDEHYQQYRLWLQEKGKDPSRETGFAPGTVDDQFNRTIRFHQWFYNQGGHLTTRFTHAHADQYEKALEEDTVHTRNGEPYTEGSKRKLQDAVLNYFKFRANEMGEQPWTTNLSFSQSEHNSVDYLKLAEREKLYEAALTYDDLGKYNDLTPEARERRKRYLAQKLEKPKTEVTPEDFRNLRTSWKIPSLVSVSLDLGARPVFFERCPIDWYKPKKGVFQIPRRESPKNDCFWEPGLSTRSVRVLDRWLSQRSELPKYDGVESIWLNREANPYNTHTLNYLLDNLLAEAGIDQSNRRITFTSIRRSTGTYLAYFGSLAYARKQLRHKSLETTRLYVEIPVEARQDVLDQLEGGNLSGGSTTSRQSPGDPPGGSKAEIAEALSEVVDRSQQSHQSIQIQVSSGEGS